MADEEMVVNWIRSQGWNEENLPSDEFRQMFDACLAGIKIGSQLDKVWHDYDAGEDSISTRLILVRSTPTLFLLSRNNKKSHTEKRFHVGQNPSHHKLIVRVLFPSVSH